MFKPCLLSFQLHLTQDYPEKFCAVLDSARKAHPKSALFVRKSLTRDFEEEKPLAKIIDDFISALDKLDWADKKQHGTAAAGATAAEEIQDLWKFMVANVSARNGKMALKMLAKACKGSSQEQKQNSAYLRVLNLDLLMTIKGMEASRGKPQISVCI